MTSGKLMLIFGAFCTIFVTILPHIVWLIGWLLSLLTGHHPRYAPFGWTPASIMFSRAYGRYDDDGQTLYVNPGLGCTAPFRIGARPEITVITLKSTDR